MFSNGLTWLCLKLLLSWQNLEQNPVVLTLDSSSNPFSHFTDYRNRFDLQISNTVLLSYSSTFFLFLFAQCGQWCPWSQNAYPKLFNPSTCLFSCLSLMILWLCSMELKEYSVRSQAISSSGTDQIQRPPYQWILLCRGTCVSFIVTMCKKCRFRPQRAYSLQFDIVKRQPGEGWESLGEKTIGSMEESKITKNGWEQAQVYGIKLHGQWGLWA